VTARLIMKLVVEAARPTTPEVRVLTLRHASKPELPSWTPGAHVDLRLPDGKTRQYSLCGDPADRARWTLAIKREEAGRGGSRWVHEGVRAGDVLLVSAPRNNFPLADSAGRHVLVAGGIGVTPLLPMMRAAAQAGRPWTLLFLARRAADAPLLREARAIPGGEVRVHASEEGSRLDVAAELAAPRPGTVLYCCGPEKLMLAVEAATAAWPEGTVRFEWFTPRSRPEGEGSGGFEITLAQRGVTLPVPPGRSVLDVLAEAGVDQPRSCEQGICGTCECRVLEGEVDHRDSILSAAERAANDVMMTCVSRAKSPRLVLDL